MKTVDSGVQIDVIKNALSNNTSFLHVSMPSSNTAAKPYHVFNYDSVGRPLDCARLGGEVFLFFFN